MMAENQLKLMNESTVEQLADLFDELSDPTRLRIIAALLECEMSVGELARTVGLSTSAISHQLHGMRDRRLIRMRKQGRHVFVCMDDEHVIELFKRGLDHVSHD